MPKKASGATTGTTPARGGAATRGTKRRRGSNNVNSTIGGPTGTGTELYGSGTIIAANPFDDDHHTPITNNTNTTMMGPNANKMMVMSPSQPNTHMHPHQQHHHLHQVPPHGQPLHQPPPPPPHSAQFQHQQRPMHHQQHPHHHPQQQHPHQVYSPHPQHHHHQHPQHQNNHYSTMQQQPMSINPHGQMGTPPIMGQGPLPPPQSMHPDHFGHHPHQQHAHPTMHNHGHMMPGQPQHLHQNYGPPPLQQQQQQQPPPPPPNHQQQTHMIGTSTPPHIMSGPAPSHSPYITPQPAPPPPPPQPQQHQPPPPHHVEQQMPVQQPPYATNHNVYCGKCERDVYQNEPHIICKAGCKLYFHISCSGLTQLACDLLLKESSAEWACDRCTSGNRQVPFVKYPTVSQLHVQ